MRYFGLRLDTVPSWVPLDWRRFQIETTFLDQFHEQSRRLDAYLNSSDKKQSGYNSSGNSNDNDVSKIYLNDEKIMKANSEFFSQATGADIAQQLDADKIMWSEFNDIANTDMDTIQNSNNFYSFDQQRAKDEIAYRKAIIAELNQVSDNVSRLGSLPRSNN